MVTRVVALGNVPEVVTVIVSVPLKTGQVNSPVNVAPASSTSVCPVVAALRAVCRLSPPCTAMVEPDPAPTGSITTTTVVLSVATSGGSALSVTVIVTGVLPAANTDPEAGLSLIV